MAKQDRNADVGEVAADTSNMFESLYGGIDSSDRAIVKGKRELRDFYRLVGEDHIGNAAKGRETAGLFAAPLGIAGGANGRGAAATTQDAAFLLQEPVEADFGLPIEGHLTQFAATSQVDPLEAIELG